MPKDKEGNQLTWKEYGERFKQGLEMISPLQQMKISFRGSLIVVVGLIIGLWATFNSVWWLFIVLCGASINTLVSLLGTWQKIRSLSKIEETNTELMEELLKGGVENV
jgi:hypothetical protein|tara:strand:+ start:148 stop:471 length:324 start_codon:yes stop_codon:yes gene_type:complete